MRKLNLEELHGFPIISYIVEVMTPILVSWVYIYLPFLLHNANVFPFFSPSFCLLILITNMQKSREAYKKYPYTHNLDLTIIYTLPYLCRFC